MNRISKQKNQVFFLARAWKIDCEILTPAQCQDKCPLLNVDDLYGGLWIPGDGVGDPYETCISLMAEAMKMGTFWCQKMRIVQYLR